MLIYDAMLVSLANNLVFIVLFVLVIIVITTSVIAGWKSMNNKQRCLASLLLLTLVFNFFRVYFQDMSEWILKGYAAKGTVYNGHYFVGGADGGYHEVPRKYFEENLALDHITSDLANGSVVLSVVIFGAVAYLRKRRAQQQ